MSILIGLHIARALKREKNITDKVGDRIFPLIVPQGVEKYPFIAYDMTGGSGASTKDGNVEDTASVQVSVVAKSHGEALRIGNYVRYALDGCMLWASICLTDCLMSLNCHRLGA